MRVVIVDDEWFGLDITYRLLTQIRMDLEVVAFFQDPLEALEKIPALKPDLIILDLEMPFINGLEVYERLKGMQTRFLIVTAHGDTYLKTKGWNQEIKILTKPFCKSEMSAVLQAMEI
jgi:two-component SAPR family response regulator